MKIEIHGNRKWIVSPEPKSTEIHFSHIQEWDDHPPKESKGNADE